MNKCPKELLLVARRTCPCSSNGENKDHVEKRNKLLEYMTIINTIATYTSSKHKTTPTFCSCPIFFSFVSLFCYMLLHNFLFFFLFLIFSKDQEQQVRKHKVLTSEDIRCSCYEFKSVFRRACRNFGSRKDDFPLKLHKNILSIPLNLGGNICKLFYRCPKLIYCLILSSYVKVMAIFRKDYK